MSMDLQNICKQTIAAVKKAGDFIRLEAQRVTEADIKHKGARDLVSYVDVQAEKILVEELHKIVPEAGFLTEEKTIADRKDLEWVIDPLDGTTNFLHGVPTYSTSVALVNKNEILVGVVLEINHNECFYAWQNGGAFLNGEPITVSKIHALKDSLISTGFPYSHEGKMERHIQSIYSILKKSHGIRRFGSAAVDLCYVACGRFDGYFEYNLNPWDIAGGALIVKEAGGRVSDFDGGADFISGKEIVASTPKILSELLKEIIVR